MKLKQLEIYNPAHCICFEAHYSTAVYVCLLMTFGRKHIGVQLIGVANKNSFYNSCGPYQTI